MSSIAALSLRNRVATLFWVGNATVCALLALQSASMYFGFGAHDAQLSGLSMRAGAALGATSATLAAFSVRKIRLLASQA